MLPSGTTKFRSDTARLVCKGEHGITLVSAESLLTIIVSRRLIGMLGVCGFQLPVGLKKYKKGIETVEWFPLPLFFLPYFFRPGLVGLALKLQ